MQRILDDARSGSDRSLGLEVLTDIHVPVLIVWGAEDRLLPLRSVEDFARIRGARVEMIPGCGHVPQLEKPAAPGARWRSSSAPCRPRSRNFPRAAVILILSGSGGVRPAAQMCF